MREFLRSDLACERQDGIVRREYEQEGYRVCEAEEVSAGERVCYRAVHVPYLAQISKEEQDCVAQAVAVLLERTAKRLVRRPACVLVACLGNPRMTPDRIGPCTASALEVTRHVQLLNPAAFSRFSKGALCLTVPGVLGDTGVESAELVRGVVREVGAELVIAVDALAAGKISHLGSVVQICDHGLRPGSGLGNRRMPLDRESLGCPVVSLGIPVVTDSAAMICDALTLAGICGVGDALSEHLLRAKRYLVAPSDIDELVTVGGRVLARAIGACFGVG